MAKKANPHPHVSWRDGRPRFQPGKELRAMGYSGKDLRHEDGRWFTRGEAVDWSTNFQQELAGKRKPAPSVPRTAPVRYAGYTVENLIADWTNPKRNPKWKLNGTRSYSPSTMNDYRDKMNVLMQHDGELWVSDVRSLDRPTCRNLFDSLWSQRGLATAKGVLLTLSSAISWGMLRGHVKLLDNPATKLQMESPEPRVRFGTRPEILALIAAADRIGRPEIGDMIVLAVWSGQRQGDRRELIDKGLMNNRRIFKQSKTGEIVAVMQAPELERRLEASKKRREAAKIKDPRVILDEKLWKSFSKRHYHEIFSKVRDAAIIGVVDVSATQKNFPSVKAMNVALKRAYEKHRKGEAVYDVRIVYEISPLISLHDLQDLDFRDTSVTWMALAGATIPEIISVTGHTAESATRILRHYLARHPEMADSAIRKMVSWYEADGETEIGY
ncbi:hypothetical protein GJU93_06055 [Brucella sp. 10RB9212]|uniref:hypothetical protein n=1 Tax=unclassified Brucella TaxID=2632610 RepID=UPI000972C45D|nr:MULTISPECIES: hypothetical protein [unclassified Brucella]APY13191.1 hypothetical protein BKD02_01720 [Brucella sp. 09RB8910]MRN46154.1 hypothetical protein [Brucella sp. 10RB9212]